MKPSKGKIVLYVFIALLALIIINWGDLKAGFIEEMKRTNTK